MIFRLSPSIPTIRFFILYYIIHCPWAIIPRTLNSKWHHIHINVQTWKTDIKFWLKLYEVIMINRLACVMLHIIILTLFKYMFFFMIKLFRTSKEKEMLIMPWHKYFIKMLSIKKKNTANFTRTRVLNYMCIVHWTFHYMEEYHHINPTLLNINWLCTYHNNVVW